MNTPKRYLTLSIPFVLALTACGGSSDSTDTTAPAVAETTAPAATETTAPDTAGAAETTAPTTAVAKVNINTATTEELVAAFEAAGVTNADKWADEVDEYRPYDATDTDFAKLRQELGKYNIDPAQLELIISVLEY